MSPPSPAPTFTYYGFCGALDALLSNLIPDVSNGHKHRLGGTAQMVHNIRHEPEDGVFLSIDKIDEIQLCLAEALENSLRKRALGYASFSLDLQLGDSIRELQPDLDTLLSECSAHLDLYQNTHLYFTYAEADEGQAVAQRKAFQNLAASTWFRENDPHKFDDILKVFEQLESEGSPEYWQIVILCRSPWL